MRRGRYLGVVAGLAVALLAGGTNTAAAADGPRVVPLGPAPGTTADVGPAAAPGKFSPLPPVRVLDTRNGTGVPVGPVGPRGTITIDLSTRVAAGATAVVLNVTGTSPTAGTFVTVYPNGVPRPLASNLNLVPGQTRPNAVTVAFEGNKQISLYNNAGNVHLIADLAGFYATDSFHAFTPMAPARVLDTRASGGPLGPGGSRTVDLSGILPSTASAVTFNLTGVGATANTFVTAWSTGEPRPTASSLNLVPGEVAPNLVTVALGSDRRFNLFNNAGSTHLIVDLAGYYAFDHGFLFYPEAPWRILDTRPDQGLTPDIVGELHLSDIVPSTTAAVLFNMTGTNATASTFVSAWPADTEFPGASNLNLVAGQTAPNLVSVVTSPDQRVWFYNNAGYVDIILDLAGYFAP